MKKGLIGLLVLIVLAVVFGGMFISAHNTIAVKSNAVDASFHDIDVNLQRRADLIPNIVASVKGYAKVETDILTKIADARAGLMSAQTPGDKLAANDRLTTAIIPLQRLQEAYPDLKSNQQFMRLEDELSGTENRIAVTRKRYNDTVLDYNNAISVFPNSLVASLSGYHRKDTYYTADPSSQAAPKVSF
jgi:LemA protein